MTTAEMISIVQQTGTNSECRLSDFLAEADRRAHSQRRVVDLLQRLAFAEAITLEDHRHGPILVSHHDQSVQPLAFTDAIAEFHDLS